MTKLALKVLEDTQQIVLIDKETGEILDGQTNVETTTRHDGTTIAVVTFEIKGDISL